MLSVKVVNSKEIKVLGLFSLVRVNTSKGKQPNRKPVLNIYISYIKTNLCGDRVLGGRWGFLC